MTRVFGEPPFPVERALPGVPSLASLALGERDHGVGIDGAAPIAVIAGRIVRGRSGGASDTPAAYLVVATVGSWIERATTTDLDAAGIGEEAEWAARAHHVSTDQPLVFLARGELRGAPPGPGGERAALAIGLQMRNAHLRGECVTVLQLVDEARTTTWPAGGVRLAAGGTVSISHP